MSPPADAYDVVDYPSLLLPQAHPNRLATLATLFGMKPAPVENCRLLDIGCGDGAHLLPCALGLPDSRFVGVDRAAVPVERGQKLAGSLGLRNISFQCADLMEFPLDGEPFDYIIAHGLYSWAPAAVRGRLLTVCRARLAPQGVAYISYNCYPGCHVRRMLWEMMHFHVRGFEEPARKVDQAAALLKFLEDGATNTDEYGALLHKELEKFAGHGRGLVYHDDLAEINEPVYFHQFMGHAAQHDLQFLAEADFFEMQDRTYPQQVRDTLTQMGRRNLLLKEQYLDFLKCRRFRQTLLCRSEVTLNREIQPARVREFRVVSAARPVSESPSLAAQAVEGFRGPRGGAMKLDHPLSKAALLCLAEAWPRSLPYADLVARARQRLEEDPVGRETLQDSDRTRDETILQEVLLAGFATDLVRWQGYQADWPRTVSDRPRLNPLARLELEKGKEVLPTLNFTVMHIEEPLDRHILLLSDGERDCAGIESEIERRLLAGELPAPGAPGPGGQAAALDVRSRTQQVLAKAALFGLLVG